MQILNLFLLLFSQLLFPKCCFKFVYLNSLLLNFLSVFEKLLLEVIDPVFVISNREQVLPFEVFELLLKVHHHLLLNSAFC